MKLPNSYLPSDMPGLVRQLNELWRALSTAVSNLDNTSDAGKPVSTAQAAADAAVQAFAIQRANHTGTQLMATISDLPTLASTTYAPTITKVTNATTATAGVAFSYMRVGNVVTVSGRIDVAATAAGLVTIGISLPIASNLTGSGQLAGGGAAAFATIAPALVLADTTNKRANYQFNAATTTSTGCAVHFTYAVV